MTARSLITGTMAHDRRGGTLFLGFGTAFRKELTEWSRGPKVRVVAGLSLVIAVFTTLLSIIEDATADPGELLNLSMDPTVNVLRGWSGEVVGLIAIVATMTLITTERDRGTLAWSLANPVSPTSVIAAKFLASVVVVSLVAVVVPLVVAIGVATVAYGGVPDLATVAAFGAMFLAVPAFYIALTVGLGAGLTSTGGVAAVALAVLFVPDLLGRMLPTLAEWSPMSMGIWAQAAAEGQPVPLATPIAWAVSMVVIVVGAKLVFDREEF
jgi:ABC-2 type transport system permease protein